MKYFKFFILLLISALVLFGCDSPAPTQLVSNPGDQNQVKVEVIAKDTGNVYYDNGFDTTGIAQTPLKYSNIITLTGTKVTQGGITTNSGYARVLFFDTSNPITSANGTILGYMMRRFNTHTMNVMFDNIQALPVPYRIKYNYNGMSVDTLLGEQYVLTDRNVMADHGNIPGRFRFKYNSDINFKISTMNSTVDFPIPTPSEITGKVMLTGRLSKKNMTAVIQWNAGNSHNLALIIGVIPKNHNGAFPLYKLDLQDKGSLTIPPKLLNEIPLNKYDKFVFTLVRKIEFQKSVNNQNLYVLSQSIHTIILDIP